MAIANEYCITVKRPNGQEVVLRQFAYNPLDAWMQVLTTANVNWPGEEIQVIAVGPPPECCRKDDLARVIDRLSYGLGKPPEEKKK